MPKTYFERDAAGKVVTDGDPISMKDFWLTVYDQKNRCFNQLSYTFDLKTARQRLAAARRVFVAKIIERGTEIETETKEFK